MYDLDLEDEDLEEYNILDDYDPEDIPGSRFDPDCEDREE